MGLYRALRSNLATQIGATCGAFKVPLLKKDYREIIGGIIFRPNRTEKENQKATLTPVGCVDPCRQTGFLTAKVALLPVCFEA
ncbi:hypothetical protein HZH68_006703 [Vespula germanica]|uniref:Uncharacterized protein n=1 Tax=Vespula germanica TaxID=30212 RepID=A0A834NDC5_VESGE|nr:hypothetical protein HZH68_006703 [Vespula germanica]